MKPTSFPALLHAFFHEWLGQQRNLSHHTVMSYRDTWRLFLRFSSERHHKPIVDLSLPDLNANIVLSFLYNTGARIQEALDVNPSDVRFESPSQVRLFGKGRKERICPLWPETVALLKALLKRQPRADHEPIFVNCYGHPLGAAGVRFKLGHYVQAAAKTLPSLAKKNISPHKFRHAAGVMLVAAGVDVTVIRSWLGHVRLDTTNIYARANLETKRKALERIDA